MVVKRILLCLGLFLLPLLACLEPGPTPMGPEASDLDPPDTLSFFENSMVLTAVESWEEPRPLFAPTMLFCGEDRNRSGFKAEPIWSFDPSGLADDWVSLDEAGLVVDLPPATWTPEGSGEILEWDNPDIDRNILVRLLRFPDWPEEDSLLENLDGLGAWPVSESLVQPALEGPTDFGIAVPLDSMQAWIDSSVSGQKVYLAFQLPGTQDSGLLRFYSRNSLAPQDTVPAPARLRISYFTTEQKNGEIACEKNAQSLSREDPLGPDEICLATGLPRYAHLSLALPDSLRRDDLMVLRARLYLYADSARTVGVGGHDRDSGGLSLRVLAPETEFDSGAPALPEDGFLELASKLDLYGADGRNIEPLAIPLTTWVQDWMSGRRENYGIILALNGSGERPRSLSFYLDEAGKDPRLEILYARRPDFD